MQIDIIRNFLEEEEANCGGRDLFLRKYNALDKLVNLGEYEKTSVNTLKKNDESGSIINCNKSQISTEIMTLPSDKTSENIILHSAHETKTQSRKHSRQSSPKRPKSRKSWSGDSEYKSCQQCNKTFSLFIRRHHCRYCGRVLCDKCSKYLLNNRRSCLDCLHNSESVNC